MEEYSLQVEFNLNHSINLFDLNHQSINLQTYYLQHNLFNKIFSNKKYCCIPSIQFIYQGRSLNDYQINFLSFKIIQEQCLTGRNNFQKNKLIQIKISFIKLFYLHILKKYRIIKKMQLQTDNYYSSFDLPLSCIQPSFFFSIITHFLLQFLFAIQNHSCLLHGVIVSLFFFYCKQMDIFYHDRQFHGKSQNIYFKSRFRMVKIVSKQRFNTIKQFQLISQKKLGCGSFGTVILARHKNTCRMYAIKMINIKELPSETEVKLIQRQIKIHSEIDHPHIIKLWDTLFDGDVIYMIMEYAQQGNLFYYQNSKGIFTQSEAFKYFTQTLQAVHYLHSNNIIHRDIKPENLLLDDACNIKLCDFGWCAQEKSMKRNTFCGTYEYMAPEMLFKGQYDYRIDTWALGVLLYQMLHGQAPFKGKSAADVKQSMVKGKYQLGQSLSQEVKKLITGLLQFNPDKRLSTEDALNHNWIKNLQMYINNNLKLENIATPKQTHQHILLMSPKLIFKKIKEESVKHRKNNTMNLFDSPLVSQELNILNYLKINKPKKHYHSQQKQSDQLYTKELDYCLPSQFNRNLLDCTNKTQNSDTNQKMKGKCIKPNKSNQKQKKGIGLDNYNKKKLKNRCSEVQELSQKYPIRFNTEMYEKQDFQPIRLKKSNIKNKILANSKSSVLKLNKNFRFGDQRIN